MLANPETYTLFLECHRLFYYDNGALVRKITTGSSASAGSRVGCSRGLKYPQVRVLSKGHSAHRIIYLLQQGWLPEQVDHINGDISDNRIENLRAATHAQNQQNRKLQSNNASGVKGVYFNKLQKQWVAQINHNKKRTHLGCFFNLEDAAAAVRQFREQHHGEFANHGVQT